MNGSSVVKLTLYVCSLQLPSIIKGVLSPSTISLCVTVNVMAIFSFVIYLIKISFLTNLK